MKSIKFIIGCLILLMVACQQQEVVESMEEPAELTLKLVVSNDASRGNVSDNPTNSTNWTQAEKVIDGRCLYAVSVYLVDATGKVAACEEVTIDNQATEVVVEFDKFSDLKRGVYTLMAVANHKDYTIGETTYQSGLSDEWETVTEGSSANTLLEKLIESSSDYISPKDVIQPLSLMKEIELHAGHNEVEGELVRTFARLRIEVKNNSGSLPLIVNNLSFSNNFTQKQACVFDDGTDRKYFGETGAPVATSTHALQPFTYDASGNVKTIDARTSAVLFDGYLLESKAQLGEDYTYTLDFSFNGLYGNTLEIAEEPLDQVDEIAQSDYEKCYFLIQNIHTERFLCAEQFYLRLYSSSDLYGLYGSSDLYALLKEGKARNFLWKLEPANENYYYIRNESTNFYIWADWDNPLSQEKLTPFIFTSNTDNGIQMLQYPEGWEFYLSHWGDIWCGGSAYSTDPTTLFRFYRVDYKSEYSKEIVLTTIDPISQQSSPVTAIKRNDFINVLVTVSYNSVAGDFDFYVENWKPGGGNVEFN